MASLAQLEPSQNVLQRLSCLDCELYICLYLSKLVVFIYLN